MRIVSSVFSNNIIITNGNSYSVDDLGIWIDLNQDGAGLVTVGITDDTLRGDAVSQGQYKGLSLWKRAATEWVIYGGTT